MARIVISDKENGKAYQIEPEEEQFRNLIGLEIGETFNGSEIDIPNYKLKITGGSDKEGFPMRGDVKGERRVKALFRGGSGYNQTEDGMRKRKTVRGNRVSAQTAQLNTVVEERGEKSIEELLGLEPEESKEAEE